MRLIFLDIDGVLVTRNGFDEHKAVHGMTASGLHAPFDRKAVANLNALTQATNAMFVISSVWRFYMTHEDLTAKFRQSGVKGAILGFTPDLGREFGVTHVSVPRGEEIARWLDDRHRQWPAPEFVIIDDDTDMLPEQLPRFVQCSGTDGFGNSECLAKALSLFSERNA